jgi:hypothetical protein
MDYIYAVVFRHGSFWTDIHSLWKTEEAAEEARKSCKWPDQYKVEKWAVGGEFNRED